MLLPLHLLPLPLKLVPLSILARSRRFISIEGVFFATQFSQGNTHLFFYMMLCCCFLFCCLSRGDGGATRAVGPMAESIIEGPLPLPLRVVLQLLNKLFDLALVLAHLDRHGMYQNPEHIGMQRALDHLLALQHDHEYEMPNPDLDLCR
ncbi:hypothetical protein SUGI_0055440 [Cryptomeria japonica]|nr:hypothetical protein SUGI_0055440 [Cryptomeria japonica]